MRRRTIRGLPVFPPLSQGETARFPDISLFELAPLGRGVAGVARGRLAMKFLGLAFFDTDLQRDTVKITPNGFAIFGLPTPDDQEMPRGIFWSCYHPEDRQGAGRSLRLRPAPRP